jgi:Domain of unknown function (DUF4440)
MLTLFLAAAVATSPSAIDAERAFSRDAQRTGQWAALRAYADPDAVIFTPQAVWARDFLKGRRNATTTISWSPNAGYVSCDGRMAVNTGPWRNRDAAQTGLFTTVWELEKGKWHWLSHGRHTLGEPIAARHSPIVHRGSCRGRAPGPPLMAPPPVKRASGMTPDDFGRGYSSDRTLGWDWRVGPKGVRHFRTFLWNGHGYTLALEQTIGGTWGQ